MDNIKQVAITGSAVSDYTGGGKKTRRGRRAALQQMGGEDDGPAPVAAPNATQNARLNIVKTGGASSQPGSPLDGDHPRGNASKEHMLLRGSLALNPPVEKITNSSLNMAALVENKSPSVTASIASVSPQQGGKPTIILAPKQKTKKVVLAPKHQQKLHLPHKKPHKQTIRRVCLPVNVIKTKIAKTRKHIKDSQSMDIDKIRKELIASKLLNPASKAPDVLLRKIYADVKIIGSN
jgi:hypothetical protein